MNQLSRHKLGLSHRLACTFLLSAHKRFVSFFLSLLSSLKHKKKQKRPTKRTYFCVCIKERENLENRDAVARCQKSTHTESTHTHAALASSNNGEKGRKGGVENFFSLSFPLSLSSPCYSFNSPRQNGHSAPAPNPAIGWSFNPTHTLPSLLRRFLLLLLLCCCYLTGNMADANQLSRLFFFFRYFEPK